MISEEIYFEIFDDYLKVKDNKNKLTRWMCSEYQKLMEHLKYPENRQIVIHAIQFILAIPHNEQSPGINLKMVNRTLQHEAKSLLINEEKRRVQRIGRGLGK